MEIRNVTATAETFTSNVYLVPEPVPTLIDAGAMSGIVDAITDSVSTIDRVLLTHQHGDHIGELDAIVSAFDPEIYAYDEIDARTNEIEDGDLVSIGGEPFEVVYTPGHAGDHVCYLGENVLFSGDVVVHDDGAFEGGSFGRTDLAGQSRERLIESIEALLDRMGPDVSELYAGHGSTFTGDVHQIIETALERAKRREPKYTEQ
ncbi:MBL fold metallo-hydrolase [Halocatena halophila]|uniref:MBL fold metallo-hydrolase n=1 Tax=Halocatena halophila TaxID=2814576 RepID=UPI002ECFEC44